MGYGTAAVCVSVISSDGIIGSSTLIVLVDMMIALLAVFSIKQTIVEALNYFKSPHDSKDPRYNLKVLSFGELSYGLIFLLIAITAYSTTAFPKIGQEYGGGKPQKVAFFIKPPNIDAMKQAGFEFPSENRSMGTQELIFETSGYFVIKPPNNFDKRFNALKIDKEIVDLSFYESEK